MIAAAETQHDELRRDVPTLIAAARRIEGDHPGTPDVRVGLGDLLETFWDELEAHMRKEEAIVFPMLRRGRPGIAVPIRRMVSEHERQKYQLDELRELAAESEIWAELRDGLQRVASLVEAHNHHEYTTLYASYMR